MSERQPLASTFTPNFLAAARMRLHAASRSDSLTPSTWSKRAIALRTCLASFRGSLRSLGKANVPDDMRSLWRPLSPVERFAVERLFVVVGMLVFLLGNIRQGRPKRRGPALVRRGPRLF